MVTIASISQLHTLSTQLLQRKKKDTLTHTHTCTNGRADEATPQSLLRGVGGDGTKGQNLKKQRPPQAVLVLIHRGGNPTTALTCSSSLEGKQALAEKGGRPTVGSPPRSPESTAQRASGNCGHVAMMAVAKRRHSSGHRLLVLTTQVGLLLSQQVQPHSSAQTKPDIPPSSPTFQG